MTNQYLKNTNLFSKKTRGIRQMPERLPKNDKSKDQINEYNKLGLRIFDISRTNIMLRRYRKTKVWTIPTIDMYDPGKRI
jgi:hypothetical protein